MRIQTAGGLRRMSEKIEWYKEVLALEPNSKIFFPLARMLADEARYDEALDVLGNGLERHGEFLEARLFFIELLYKAGRQADCAAQIERLQSMFSGYAGFWQAWAACLATSSDAHSDTASVLRLLAAYFLHGPISLHKVLDDGLDRLLGDTPLPSRDGAGNAALAANGEEGEPLSAATDDADEMDGAGETLTTDTALEASLEEPDALPEESEVSSEEPHAVLKESDEDFNPDAAMSDEAALPESPHISLGEMVEASGSEEPANIENEENEEQFTLRTRSMAEVLAEQGDIKGALDIYQELAAVAVSPEESADLKLRMNTLRSRLDNVHEPEMDQAASQEDVGSDGKNRLISMLEALAERVEARAQG